MCAVFGPSTPCILQEVDQRAPRLDLGFDQLALLLHALRHLQPSDGNIRFQLAGDRRLRPQRHVFDRRFAEPDRIAESGFRLRRLSGRERDLADSVFDHGRLVVPVRGQEGMLPGDAGQLLGARQNPPRALDVAGTQTDRGQPDIGIHCCAGHHRDDVRPAFFEHGRGFLEISGVGFGANASLPDADGALLVVGRPAR